MNYTIAVPIIKEDKTVGSIFGSIYFDDIQAIIERNKDAGRRFYLLGSDLTLMVDGQKETFGKTFEEHMEETRLVGITPEELKSDYSDGKPNGHWEWGRGVGGLSYVTSMRVPPTDWTLVFQMNYSSVLQKLLPVMVLKTIFYILLSVVISLGGRRYLKRQLGEVSHMWEKITQMQRELFKTDQSGYDAILDLTAKGLTDQLTGLFTRSVLFSKMQTFISDEVVSSALFFLDLDDLKRINDTFGHETGDRALVHFAGVLKNYTEEYDGLAARYGGDEFILILKISAEQDVASIAEKLCTDLRTVIDVKGLHVPINGSVGVALCPQNGQLAEDLICKADLALYMAKRNGKNRVAFYDESVNNAL